MSKLVVIRLRDGNFEQEGFSVTLQIGDEGKHHDTEIIGKLPSAPELPELYDDWQFSYRRLGLPVRLEAPSADVTNIATIANCQEAAEILTDSFNQWLNSEPFRPVKETFLRKLKPSDKIRIILQTENSLLRRLPWHLWELVAKDYTKAEIALSALKSDRIESPKTSNKKVRILAILGNSEGIDIEEDRKLLKKLLPGAEVRFLVEPRRQELTEKLWEQGWDILFFAGHSSSDSEGHRGRICINSTDSFSLEELKSALRKAIEGGLKLAIFNSCDGLGLATELAQLHIPQLIVMREPVPDKVAQAFLKYFLTALAGGKSLYLAVREAREKLEGLEDECPCASWLPVICQNPAQAPFVFNRNWVSFPTVSLASIAIAALIIGVRYLGVLQPLELKAYDQMMQLRPNEGLDPRILVVGVNKDDINAQDSKERGWFSLSDARLVRLLKEIKKYQPRAIGLDMYRDLPLDAKPNADLEKLFQENENLFAVCKVRDLKSGDVRGIPPAPFIPKENLVFSDVLLDSDQVLRRHLLSIEPSSPCAAENALSWQLAQQYLYPIFRTSRCIMK